MGRIFRNEMKPVFRSEDGPVFKDEIREGRSARPENVERKEEDEPLFHGLRISAVREKGSEKRERLFRVLFRYRHEGKPGRDESDRSRRTKEPLGRFRFRRRNEKRFPPVHTGTARYVRPRRRRCFQEGLETEARMAVERDRIEVRRGFRPREDIEDPVKRPPEKMRRRRKTFPDFAIEGKGTPVFEQREKDARDRRRADWRSPLQARDTAFGRRKHISERHENGRMES